MNLWMAILPFIAAFAVEPAPERKVEISIYDLISKQKIAAKISNPELTKDYGQKVANVVIASRTDVMKCIPKVSDTMEISVSLQITAKGHAENVLGSWKPESAEHETEKKCVLDKLAKLPFPTHKLNHSVALNFPMIFTKEKQ